MIMMTMVIVMAKVMVVVLIMAKKCLSAFMRRPPSNRPVFRWHAGDYHHDHDGDDGGGLNFGNLDGGVIGEGHV